MNIPVSFEIAVLLKKRKFANKSKIFYYENTKELSESLYSDDHNDVSVSRSSPICSAPTIVEVIMWIYEKDDIWITVQPTSIVGKFQFRIYWNNNGLMNQHWNDFMNKEFNSPIEAYEAGIKYYLTKKNYGYHL